MKKFIFSLALILLCMPWAVNAQETLTVCDGTETYYYLPFDGDYASTGTRNQFIIPANDLVELDGMTISKLTFYLQGSESLVLNGTKVYLKEVDYTIFASQTLEDWSSMTSVYEGSLSVNNQQLEITFSTPYTYHGGNLMIGVQVPGDNNSKSTTWYGKRQDYNHYTGISDNAYSLNTWGVNVSRHYFIPKTTFTFTPSSCAKPTTFETSDVTSSSAILTWGGGSAPYNVDYKKASENNWTSLLANSNLTTTNLTGLQSGTNYLVRVQSLCSNNVVSSYKSTSFTTPCGTISPGYTCDFEGPNESTSHGIMPLCWSKPSAETYPCIPVLPTAAHSGSRYLLVSNNPAVLPQIGQSLNGLRLSFYASTDNSGTVYIGYMTDPTQANTFEAVGDPINVTSSYPTTPYFADFYSYSGDPRYMAIKCEGGSVYIDDVSLSNSPSCVPTTGLSVSNITATGATFSWNGMEGEAFQYFTSSNMNATPGENDWIDATNWHEISLANAFAPNTDNIFYLRNKCSETDFSGSVSVTFHTLCEIVSNYPFTEDFNSYSSLPSCWSFLNTYDKISISSNYAVDGKCLFFESEYGASLYAVFPQFDTAISNLSLTFTYKKEAGTTLYVGYMTDPANISTFVDVKACEQNNISTTPDPIMFSGAPAGSYIAFRYYGGQTSREDLGIDNVTVDLLPACPVPTDLAVVANSVTAHTAQLDWTSDASKWQICLNGDEDNLFETTTKPYTVEGVAESTEHNAKVRAICGTDTSLWTNTVNFTTPLACPAPTSPAVTDGSITAHGATLTWTGTSDSYEVLVGEEVAIPVKSYDFEGYEISSDFTNVYVDGQPHNIWVSTNQDHHGGSRSIRSADMQAWGESDLILEVDLPAACTVSFWAKISSEPEANNTADYGYFRIDGQEKFKVSGTSSDWTFYSYELSAGTHTMVWKYQKNGVSAADAGDDCLYLDDLSITYNGVTTWMSYPATASPYDLYDAENIHSGATYRAKVKSVCEGEVGHESSLVNFTTIVTCQEPTNLAASNITCPSADLSWTPGSDENAWTVYYKKSTETAYAHVSAPSNPFTLTGLEGGSDYDCYVVANCSTDPSNGSEVIHFNVPVTASHIVNTVTNSCTEMTWDQFAGFVNSNANFTHTNFILMDDISVSTMVGTESYPFSGTFDGDGHTITVNYTATDNNLTAPFRYVNAAFIQNLKVDGEINMGNYKFGAGLVGRSHGSNTYINCVSDVTINATINGDGTHGGFVAINYEGVSTFRGCAFTGKLLGPSTNMCGGFCGWNEYKAQQYGLMKFYDCLFAPEEVTMDTTGSATFSRSRDLSKVYVSNSYYTQSFGTVQGTQVYTVIGVNPVTVAMAGAPTVYDVSSVQAYATGLVYNGTIIAGAGDVLTLILAGGNTYDADHGTLTGTVNPFTLTMDAYNTVISVMAPAIIVKGVTRTGQTGVAGQVLQFVNRYGQLVPLPSLSRTGEILNEH